MKRSVARLLILDDQEDLARSLRWIAEDIGFEVQCVTSAKEFFEVVEGFAPTHVALDLVVPDMDGVEIMRRLSMTDFHAALILTSGMGKRVLESARTTGAERGLHILGILPKPFSPIELRMLLSSASPDRVVDDAPTRPPSVDEVAQAIDAEAFTIVAQPKVDLRSGRVVGAEILGRWHSDMLGSVSPEVFVRIAEQNGIMSGLCTSTFTQALDWFSRSPLKADGGHLSLNLSTTCLSDVTLADRIEAACVARDVATQSLVLEITESVAMDRTADSFDTLTRLRLKGFRLSVDDFGTGYSSLIQLARLPLTELKIDRSFVMALSHSTDAHRIVDATIRLAQGMDLVSVAEGVEDPQSLADLREMGCDLAQGFYLAKPMAPSALDAWFTQNQGISHDIQGLPGQGAPVDRTLGATLK